MTLSPDAKQLVSFRSVMATGSVRRAADDLNVEPSVVSRHLARLSADLGVKLFERKGRRLVATEAAHLLLSYSRERIASDQALHTHLDELRGLKRGILNLMVGDAFVEATVNRLLADFCRDHPGIHITLRVGGTQEVVRALVDDECDLGFTLSSPSTESVRVVRDRQRPIRMVMSPSHPLAALAEPIPLRAVFSHPVALATQGAGLRSLLELAAEQEGVELAAHFAADRVETLRRYAAAGVGITFLSERAVANELASGTLISRRTASTVLETVRAQVLVRAGRSLSAPLRVLLGDDRLLDMVL